MDKQLGATLVELTIAVAILLGLSGVATTSYLTFNEKQSLEQSGLTLNKTLQFAQNKALVGEKDQDTCGAGIGSEGLVGWCFSPYNNGEGYRIYGACGNAPSVTPAVYPMPPVENELPLGIKLTVNSRDSSGWKTQPQDVASRTLFRPLGEGALLANTALEKHEEVAYCLEGTLPSLGTNSKYVIRVLSTGEIIDVGITDKCPWE